jgi:hypothetical protein
VIEINADVVIPINIGMTDTLEVKSGFFLIEINADVVIPINIGMTDTLEVKSGFF